MRNAAAIAWTSCAGRELKPRAYRGTLGGDGDQLVAAAVRHGYCGKVNPELQQKARFIRISGAGCVRATC